MMAWRRNSSFLVGAGLIILFLGAAILGPWLRSCDSLALPGGDVLASPDWTHPFGTNDIGRDLLAQTLAGARLSLLVGFLSRLLALALGTAAGLVAGYRGGRTDSLIMRLADMTMAFPALLLLIAIVAATGPSLIILFVALGVLGWASVARVIRGQVLSLREEGYVEAARALGASTPRILLKHILPGCVSSLLVLFSVGMGQAIIAEGSLSFLGLGAQPPQTSWGILIKDGFPYLRSAPWLTLIPGAVMAATVLGFNLLGDGLRDLLDPRRGSSC